MIEAARSSSFAPRNNFEIGLSHFFLDAAFLTDFSSLYLELAGV